MKKVILLLIVMSLSSCIVVKRVEYVSPESASVIEDPSAQPDNVGLELSVEKNLILS